MNTFSRFMARCGLKILLYSCVCAVLSVVLALGLNVVLALALPRTASFEAILLATYCAIGLGAAFVLSGMAASVQQGLEGCVITWRSFLKYAAENLNTGLVLVAGACAAYFLERRTLIPIFGKDAFNMVFGLTVCLLFVPLASRLFIHKAHIDYCNLLFGWILGTMLLTTCNGLLKLVAQETVIILAVFGAFVYDSCYLWNKEKLLSFLRGD